MPDDRKDAPLHSLDGTIRKPQEERRTQPRGNTVLSRIEDATYEILRRHEKQSA